MKPLVLDKAKLDDFLKGLSTEFEIFAPRRQKKGLVDWGRIEGTKDMDLSPGVPKTSIKGFFFPQPECLFEFSARSGDEGAFRLKEPKCPEKKRLIFGARPCDARSVFLNSYPYEDDCYFQKKRDQNLIMGLFCKEALPTCFCTWVGGSPTSREGMDVGIYDLGDELLFVPITERGKGLLGNSDLEDAKEHHVSAANEYSSSIAQEGLGRELDLAKEFTKKGLFDLYNAPFWQEITAPCLNCGTCTFLCPTCYCFDIQDEVLRGKGRRIRYWDSCMFSLFTLHASGHNPRGDKVKRVRNRFMHKLKYFPDRFGPLSCVGCGRCVRDCPVSIDIRQIIRKFLEI